MGTTGAQPVASTTPRCLQKKRPIYYLISGASIKMSHVVQDAKTSKSPSTKEARHQCSAPRSSEMQAMPEMQPRRRKNLESQKNHFQIPGFGPKIPYSKIPPEFETRVSKWPILHLGVRSFRSKSEEPISHSK